VVCEDQSVGRIPSTKKAMAVTIVQIALRMVAIDSRFVIFSHKPNVWLNSSAVFETETKIRISLEHRLLITVRREGEISLNSNSPFKTDSKTISCVRIVQFGRQMIVFCSADEVLPNSFPIFETTHKIIQHAATGMGYGLSII
jgi:hypothetical protein